MSYTSDIEEDLKAHPNLFAAAIHNDLEQLEAGITAGLDINEKASHLLDMTPAHLACIYGSNEFLERACQTPMFDPWARDANMRLSFDHAAAKNNHRAMNILHPLLYPDSPWIELSPS